MDINERVAQWEKMTQEAPDDMAWFSLGNAYRESGRLDDADRALAEAVRLNPGLSRAYQERGQVLMDLGRVDEAGGVLSQGYAVAARRGDRMPQEAIGALLEQIGQAVPEVTTQASPVADAEASGDTVTDRRTGLLGTRMTEPPMRGPLGQLIGDHYSQETWREWIGQGTKVINELRLDFSKPDDQTTYEQQMKEWLGISDQQIQAYAAQQEQSCQG